MLCGDNRANTNGDLFSLESMFYYTIAFSDLAVAEGQESPLQLGGKFLVMSES